MVDYKGEMILIKKRDGKRIFTYGTTEFPSLKDAKDYIDKIPNKKD